MRLQDNFKSENVELEIGDVIKFSSPNAGKYSYRLIVQTMNEVVSAIDIKNGYSALDRTSLTEIIDFYKEDEDYRIIKAEDLKLVIGNN